MVDISCHVFRTCACQNHNCRTEMADRLPNPFKAITDQRFKLYARMIAKSKYDVCTYFHKFKKFEMQILFR